MNRERRSRTAEHDHRPTRPHPARNDPCHCGSERKYRRCCREQDDRASRAELGAKLPGWINESRRRLYQFEKYTTQVCGLTRLLASFRDGRREPTNSTFDVANTLVHAAVLRRPSINATEGDLRGADFQKLIGRTPRPGLKAFSAEVISDFLDKLDLSTVRDGLEDLLRTAERNKAFREGSYGTLRCVALDGWEVFSSYDRHCHHCLTREVSVKNHTTGEVVKRTQYYHRCVVAMLIGPTLDVALDMEPVLNAEARRDLGEDARHEGELTAAHRLMTRLHNTWGTFIDALVLDALYDNGPIMTKLDECGFGAFIVLKKDNNEPLKEALALWEGQGPCAQHDDEGKKEHVEFWDAGDIDTLDTYAGKVRVIRAVITKDDRTRGTWCIGIVGARAQRVSRRTALEVTRARWHLENTGFCQWAKYWNLGHVYRHTPNAVQAILLIWMLAFNLLQLFVYRRLKRRRKPQDPCDTILNIVAEMLRDIGALPESIPWLALADTS